MSRLRELWWRVRGLGLVELWELLFAALALWAALPLWLVKRPPIQDLPQHLAAIRVLHDYSSPELGFSQFFELDLHSTQYLAYYLAAHLLAYPFGVMLANRLLLTLAIVGLPYAMRSLLRALGRDEALALFVLPLTWNAHLILGFANFIAAIPLAVAGLALAVRDRIEPSRMRLIALAVIGLVTFYTHIVPFAFLALGVALLAVGSRKAALRLLGALAPAAIGAAVWSRTTPAGRAVFAAAGGGHGELGIEAKFMRWSDALREAPAWLTDVLQDEIDDKLFVAWAVLLLACIAFGAIESRAASPDEDMRTQLARRLAPLAPIAAIAYFVTPSSYDWIWPINARFPLLALVFLIPVLPEPRRLVRLVLLGGVIVVSVISFRAVGGAFRRFERDEMGALDRALATIPPGKKVVGLIWDRSSRIVKFSPFLHSVAWYQVEKGGAVMFTFADFPQSPFKFKRENRPPHVPPRWEWMPGAVNPQRDLGWYDFVLTRGEPGRLRLYGAQLEPVYEDAHWNVWRIRH